MPQDPSPSGHSVRLTVHEGFSRANPKEMQTTRIGLVETRRMEPSLKYEPLQLARLHVGRSLSSNANGFRAGRDRARHAPQKHRKHNWTRKTTPKAVCGHTAALPSRPRNANSAQDTLRALRREVPTSVQVPLCSDAPPPIGRARAQGRRRARARARERKGRRATARTRVTHHHHLLPTPSPERRPQTR
jgi:hypothetical protein